ncbi:hypothetical protein IPA_08700 [Ignicoccus pacificus DSM 13166]|uniref:Citrate transporter-like domain-containing protein n=1 Tax=Ignicoccus pacificus DSM 13166 TaxID=940294 RepID=A0A977PKG3_9CREN|nr:hypothetical protein IPA_08700 [Ignicoccus pacificus DSM 13166]
MRKDPLLIALIALSIAVAVAFPSTLGRLKELINIKALVILANFMIISEMWRESNAFEKIALGLSDKGGLKVLAGISALAGAILMNDAAMFFMVPIALAMDPSGASIPLIAAAVNIGSMITPFGNPQNVIIWTHYSVDFLSFILNTLPASLVPLAIIVYALPPRGKLKEEVELNKRIFALAFVLLVLSISLIEKNMEWIALALSLLTYVIINRKVPKIDFNLLIILALMMYSFGSLGYVLRLAVGGSLETMLVAAGLSQAISNVPATLILIKSNPPWRALTLGVDIGGLGTPIASLSNLIALRLSGYDYWEFTKVNVLLLVISLGILCVTSLVLGYP